MPRAMFDDVVAPSIKVGSRKWYTVPLSIAVHAAIVAALVIVPLMAADALPAPPSMMAFVASPPPPPPPLPPPPPRRHTAPQRPASAVAPNAAPVAAPSEITPETGMEGTRPEPDGVIGGIPAGDVLGIVALEPPPPPPPPAPVRVGGSIKAPTQVKRVNPDYPPIARSARVEGIVIIEAVIGPSGSVDEVKVLRSIPLLDAAAVEAVKQWQYTPTLLNGVPVPVIMTVTVNFTLQ